MASDLCNGETTDGPAAGDLEAISSFFLASDLVIKGFADALFDLLPPGLEAQAPTVEAGACRRRRRLSDSCPAVVPETPPETPPESSINALAARCAILLQRDLEI